MSSENIMYVVSTTTVSSPDVDPSVVMSALITAVAVLGAGIFGAVITSIATQRQNDSENERLKLTLKSQAERDVAQRLFEARIKAYTPALELLSAMTVKRANCAPGLLPPTVEEARKVDNFMSLIHLLGSPKLVELMTKRMAIFASPVPASKEEKDKDWKKSLELDGKISEQMREDLGM